jgi:hypothetical protein
MAITGRRVGKNYGQQIVAEEKLKHPLSTPGQTWRGNTSQI